MKLTPEDFLNGQIILVNKPRTWTSFDVVNKMRSDLKYIHQIPNIKIGHAGTLDPLASGLLIICIGRATKKIENFQGLEKEYTGTMMLGSTTPSYDMETDINERYSITHLTHDNIQEATKKFIGAIWQYPPAFSAKRIDGKRAYLIARQGGQAEMKPILVTVIKFEIVDILLPMVEFKVTCGKGTYIRSLVHDFGKELNCGAVLTSLSRTGIGKHKLKQASEIKDWLKTIRPQALKKRMPSKTAAKKMKERAVIREKSGAGKKNVKVKSKKSAVKKKITSGKSKRANKKQE